MKHYTKIRFIGYAVPTEPAGLIPLGNLQRNGCVAGHYIGSPVTKDDIAFRVEAYVAAVAQARANIPQDDDTINVFLAPEFFFHGVHGPYLWRGNDKNDPLKIARELFQQALQTEDYANWIFITGSMISIKTDDNLWQLQEKYEDINKTVIDKCNLYLSYLDNKEYELAESLAQEIGTNVWNAHGNQEALPVQNRTIMINNINPGGPKDNWGLMTMQKKFYSNQDIALFGTNYQPLITEQMTRYPEVDISKGDVKKSAFDHYSIFKVQNGAEDKSKKGQPINMGVDICLDHLYYRLRRTYTKDKAIIGGDVQVQVFPSCGVQVMEESVVAGLNGYVFNCDGAYYFPDKPIFKGNYQSYKGNIINLPFSSPLYKQGVYQYGAHTQLAQVASPAVGDIPFLTDASIKAIPQGNATVIPVTPALDFDQYFAGGPGELHVYGLQNGFPL